MDVVVEDCTLFEVVDARPENKYQLKTGSVKKSVCRILVKELPVAHARPDGVMLLSSGTQRYLDLLHYCLPDHFNELMGCLFLYKSDAADVKVDLQPLLDISGGMQPALCPPAAAFAEDAGLDVGDALDPFAAEDAEDAMMLGALAMLGPPSPVEAGPVHDWGAVVAVAPALGAAGHIVLDIAPAAAAGAALVPAGVVSFSHTSAP